MMERAFDLALATPHLEGTGGHMGPDAGDFRVTELARRPRDNDQLEPLDGAYKRLEAQYGGWENSGAGVGGSALVILALLLLGL